MIEIDPETVAGTFVLNIRLPCSVQIVRALAASQAVERYCASVS